MSCRVSHRFLWYGLIGLQPNDRHHRKCQHHERHVTIPSVPGPGFVMVEPDFVFGGFETVFDRPAVAFDGDQGFDRGSHLAPG